EVVGATGEVGGGLCGEAFGGHLVGGGDDLAANFVGVPSGHQRDMGLLASGVYLGDGFGKEPAVDDGAKAWRRVVVHDGADDVFGGDAPQLGELAGAPGSEGEGDVGLFALLECGIGAATGGDGSAAFADAALEEAA